MVVRYLVTVAHKIAAVYLAWFVLVFLLVIFDLHSDFFAENTRDFLARYPFAIDYELMFAALSAVWAYFLWMDKHLSLFSGVAFLSQAVAMAVLAIGNVDTVHFFVDMIPWFILGVLLVYSAQTIEST